MKVVDIRCLMLLIAGQKKSASILCLCRTDSLPADRAREGVGVRGAEVRPHHSVQLYFRAFCLFTLDAASIRPAAFCYLFSL